MASRPRRERSTRAARASATTRPPGASRGRSSWAARRASRAARAWPRRGDSPGRRPAGQPIAAFDDALGHLRDRATCTPPAAATGTTSSPQTCAALLPGRCQPPGRPRGPGRPRAALRQSRERRGFRAVHVWPGSADVVDVPRVRLVMLAAADPRRRAGRHPRAGGRARDPRKAGHQAAPISQHAGLPGARRDGGPRADEAARTLLAWQSMRRDADVLPLDALQRQQVAEHVRRAEETASVRLPQTYCWLLIRGSGAGPGPGRRPASPAAWRAAPPAPRVGCSTTSS